jgi:outer membrane protein assembly factor BamB
MTPEQPTVAPTQNAQTDKSTFRRPLRLWPGIVLAALLLLVRFIIPFIAPESLILGIPTPVLGILAGLLLGLAIVGWWLFFSRAPWLERLGVVALMILAMVVMSRIIHVSILTGAMGMLYPALAIPVLMLAFVAAVAITRKLETRTRRAIIAVVIVLACGGWALVRTGGFTGELDHDFAWRWSKTPEELLLVQEREELANAPTQLASSSTSSQNTGADWPGFRGPGRDSLVRGVKIETDWSKSPPVELWRRPIGPAWSSFAVHGDLVYTQEQRGDSEVVSCYNLTTGKPVWRHSDAARFWESNAGAGPRGTPTLSDGRVYTFGGTGILNALDAATGKVLWTRNAATDTHKKLPGWGFSSSPLVVGDVVIVAPSGAIAAYDVATGTPRWVGPDGGSGYSSPQLVTLHGVPQVLFLSGAGATSFSPTDGKQLWQYALGSGTRIVQPGVTADGDILAHDGEGNGMRRIAVALGPSGWTAEERWNAFGLNPYFNDFVVHKDHAFGFDGSNLACIDLKDGERKWKGGRYGTGQLILLADQDLLLVLSEGGELALVGATPGQFTELARFPAIKGKTWNHPVLARDVLLVRNGEEMAAFRLTRAAG